MITFDLIFTIPSLQQLQLLSTRHQIACTAAQLSALFCIRQSTISGTPFKC